ncbi:MAG: hypothetical protein U0869_05140 [Chloroflexota bacterium]
MPGHDPVIRAVALAARGRGWQTIGLLGGFDGLVEPIAESRPILDAELDGLLTRGGDAGSANRGAFAAKVGSRETRQLPAALLDEVRDSVRTRWTSRGSW